MGNENLRTSCRELANGTRTIMLHGGEIMLDVGSDNRKNMQVEDLITMFRKISGQTLETMHR